MICNNCGCKFNDDLDYDCRMCGVGLRAKVVAQLSHDPAIIKEEYKVFPLYMKYATDMFSSLEDELLTGLTYRELIDTVYSNEECKDETTVRETFGKLIEQRIENARILLVENMDKIIEELFSEEEN